MSGNGPACGGEIQRTRGCPSEMGSSRLTMVTFLSDPRTAFTISRPIRSAPFARCRYSTTTVTGGRSGPAASRAASPPADDSRGRLRGAPRSDERREFAGETVIE